MGKPDSKKYHKVKNQLFFVGFFLDIIILLVLFFSGLTFIVRDFAASISSYPVIMNASYIFILGSAMYVLHLPFHVFTGFFWEHKFNLSNQKFSQWLWDNLKKNILGFAFFLILVEVVYMLLGKNPQGWWVGAGFFWLFLTFVLAKLTPNVLIPLFYKYSSLENSYLKQKIFKLFKFCKVSLKDIYTINLSAKTKKANAFLCGLGQNRRVVLSDTLLSNFSEEEIEVVVAHELGHYKHRDIVKILCVNSLIIFIGFYIVHKFLVFMVQSYNFARMDDIALFPMMALAFLIFGFITTPLTNAYSRFIEREADRFSIETTKNPNVFISLMKKLGKINLSEKRPARLTEIFFYDHPPIYKRIAFAENFIDRFQK